MGQVRLILRWAALFVVLSCVLSCAPRQPERIPLPRNPSPAGLERTRVDLEGRLEREPRSVALHLALGEIYYRIARDALDRTADEAAYLDNFARANESFVAALALDPARAEPHTFLGVMDAYRGDLDAALRAMRNARKLHPYGHSYSNIAEILVYRGQLDQARQWNALAAQKGASYGATTLNAMLIAWRSGNLRLAESNFQRLAIHSPESLREINMARVPRPPERFEEFAAYCCQSPACGPYMRDACEEVEAPVSERELTLEALRREIEIEKARRDKLETIYRQRRELEIEVESEE